MTDLPRLICGCGGCAQYQPTQRERAEFASLHVEADPPGHVWVRRIGYHGPQWTEPEPERIICDHGKPEGMIICDACAHRFALLLADVPMVITELDLALTKQTGFVERGVFQEADPDEAAVPWDEGASKIIRRLFAALGGRPVARSREMLDQWRDTLRRPDLEELVSRVSAVMASAHKLVDTPSMLTYYGPCPNCKRDIIQEHAGPDDMIKCPCGYLATRADHLYRQLDAQADLEMPLTRIVKTLNDGGEPVTRQEIENLIYRRGLPRTEHTIPPHWVGKGTNRRLAKAETIWVYRLGDVRLWRARYSSAQRVVRRSG